MPYLDDLVKEKFEEYVTDNLNTLSEEYEHDSGVEKYFTIREWEKGERNELFVEWAKEEFEESNKPL